VLSSAKANISVASSSGLSLSFHGPKALTFAFTCQRLILNKNGHIMQMPPDTQIRAFVRFDATPVLLTEGSDLLEWDEL
jgi:hypothetical protein